MQNCRDNIMMIMKPKLTAHEQIVHLKDKGILFNIMDEKEAEEYLKNKNNYFKLASYRKNYQKYPSGKNKGKYLNLEFAYLVDLAVIDMKLRYQIICMALDIEHHAKIELLQKVEENQLEDGYQIVNDYEKALSAISDDQIIRFEGELSRNQNNLYCGAIYQKYAGNFPIWALLEIISFGRLVNFYKYCAERFNDGAMLDNFYRLLKCKEIRNASAHSSCILNDLRSTTFTHKTNSAVTHELMKIKGMKPNFRSLKMGNERIQEIVTLLYVHKVMVNSQGLHKTESEGLHKVIDRMYKHIDYYKDNAHISGTFDFLKMVVDNWF